MAGKRISWKYYPSYLLFKAFCGFLRLLPQTLVWLTFSAASRLAYLLDAKHRKIALRNLDLAFGESKTGGEKRRFVRASFKSLFLTVAELILIPALSRTKKPLGKFQTPDDVGRALRKGKGVIFLVSHFGNWEIMAHACVSEGYKLASVARPLKNPLIDQEIEGMRCFNGAVILKKKWVAREIIKRLKKNWCIAILADQYAGRYAPFVPFFGHPVSTSPAVALLAMRTGAVVLPAFNVRKAYGKNHIYTCDPVEISHTDNKDKDIIENCARFNRIIEEWVRRYPDHWLWMHRRWRRKKAPGEP